MRRSAEVDGLNRFCAEYNLSLIVDEVFLDYAIDGSAPLFVCSRTTAF